MKLYEMLRNQLFRIDPETMHEFTLDFCNQLGKVPGVNPVLAGFFRHDTPSLQVKLGNLTFPNPIGLAAGYDKDGLAVPLMSSLGFGFLEVGTVTPIPQSGNPKQRLFRLPEDRAIINRMGFNNLGVEQLVSRLSRINRNIPIGVNIGKNKQTPIEKAADDYLACLRTSWAVADYFTINISSPNTENLRSLQEKRFLAVLLEKILLERDRLAQRDGQRKQIWLKLSPDLDDVDLNLIAETVLQLSPDALILTNTTVARNELQGKYQTETGGLSGNPLRSQANHVLAEMYRLTQGKIPLVGVGGVFNTADALEKLTLGASLIQVFTGLIYEGPALVKRILNGLEKFLHQEGMNTISEITAQTSKRVL